ncbi:hypothetical protein JCM19000A_32780 [Silvimonas sp. JCM 19000]
MAFDPRRLMRAAARIGFTARATIGSGPEFDAMFHRKGKVAKVEGFDVDDATPVLECNNADLPPDPYDETVLVIDQGEQSSWLVIGVDPDSYGFTYLRLRKL